MCVCDPLPMAETSQNSKERARSLINGYVNNIINNWINKLIDYEANRLMNR